MIIIIQFRFSAVSGTQDAIECSRFGLAFPKYLPKFDIIEEQFGWVVPQPCKMLEFLGWVVSQHSFMRLGGCLLPSSTGNLEGQGQLFVWSLSLSHYSRVLFNSRVWPTKIEQPFWFWQFWNKTSHMWRVFGTQYLNYVWCPFCKFRSQNPTLLKVELAALVLLTEKMY